MKLRQFIPVLIIAAGIWAYHNSFQGPFIYDDVPSIVQNPHIRHFWPIREVLFVSPNLPVQGRPVESLTLALNYALGGLNVGGYHAFNLAVHLLSALVLFGILRRTLGGEKLRGRFGAASVWLAAAIALIWEVHPLQTESVDYIVQRSELLMGLFLLLALYCTLRGTGSSRPGRWYLAAVISCALGMGSKEVMVGAPLIVLLYDRVFLASSFRDLWRRRAGLHIGLAATWLILAALVARTVHPMTRFGVEGLTSWDYLKTEAGVIVYYLRLCFWPQPLVIDYSDWPIARSLRDALVPVLAVVGLVGATVWAFRRRPWLGFWGAWFFLILAPTSSFLPSAGEAAAERRMYLPLAAVVTMAVVGAFSPGKRLLNKRQGIALGCIASVSVVVLLTHLTIQRNRDYISEATIWQDAVEKRPGNARAHNNLGFALAEIGRVAEAVGHYEEALRIQPGYDTAHYNLGNALVEQGRVAEAIAQYEEALRIKPADTGAHYNLGLALVRQGRVAEAIEQYEEALRIAPDFTDTGSYAEIHNDLGLALVQQGRVPEAMEHYEQALRINPGFAAAHYNLGVALVELGRVPEAIKHWEEAARIMPDYADAHYNLGLALWQAGQLTKAVGHYEQALRINPDFVEARVNLGIALSQLGKRQEGLAQFQEALRRQPDSAQVHYNVGRALFQTGHVPEAIEQYQLVLQTSPRFVEAYCDLGLALARLGRTAEAIQQYEQALKLRPDFAPAKRALAELESTQ